MVVLGENELKRDMVRVRNVDTREEIEVPREIIVEKMKALLAGSGAPVATAP